LEAKECFFGDACLLELALLETDLLLTGRLLLWARWQWYSPVFLFVWHPFESKPPPWANAVEAQPSHAKPMNNLIWFFPSSQK
jgi:hypothetical protein